MRGAGEPLAAAVMASLEGVQGLSGCYEGRPLQATFPYALVEAGLETDWGHKSGNGREVRLAVTVRDEGERPARLRELMAEVEAAVAGTPQTFEGWRLVTLVMLRSNLLPESGGRWSGVLLYRARLLAA